MGEAKGRIDANVTDRIVAQLRKEFIEESLTELESIGEMLEDMRDAKVDVSDRYLVLKRWVHNLKGQGGTFDLHSVTAIAHRLEDYLDGISHFRGNTVPEIYAFIDWIERILEKRQDLEPEHLSRVIRRLPAPPNPNARPERFLNKEALVVIPSKVAHGIVRASLESQGIRVVSSYSSIEGFILSVSTRPDLVIASAIMDGVSGIDLASALVAMPKTCEIPVILVTSLEQNNPALKKLPASVSMVPYDKEIQNRICKTAVEVLEIKDKTKDAPETKKE